MHENIIKFKAKAKKNNSKFMIVSMSKNMKIQHVQDFGINLYH